MGAGKEMRCRSMWHNVQHGVLARMKRPESATLAGALDKLQPRRYAKLLRIVWRESLWYGTLHMEPRSGRTGRTSNAQATQEHRLSESSRAQC